MAIEHAPFRSELIPRAGQHRRRPSPGEHTREICTGLLGMDPDDVDRLLASGVLEEPVRARIRAARTARVTASLRDQRDGLLRAGARSILGGLSRSAETSIVSSRIVT